MVDSREQMRILKEIIQEDFRAKEAGIRGGGYSTLFEVTYIDGVKIPEGLNVVVNFDNGKKAAWFSSENINRIDQNFVGNLNVFVMRKKKVLRRVHVTYTQEKFKTRQDTCSLRMVLQDVS